jgi:hypothetical protein
LRSTLITSLFVVACAAISGCAPSVRYTALSESDANAATVPDSKGNIKFRLSTTVVYIDYDLITYKSYKDAGLPVQVVPIKATTVATEADGTTFLVEPTPWFWQNEALQISYQGDNKLPKAIGVDVTDELPQYIQAAGTVASLAIAASALNAPPPLNLPAAIDINSHLTGDTPKTITWTGAAATNGWKYSIEIGPVSAAALERNKFLASISGTSQSVLFYSACRDAKITLGSDTPYPNKVLDLTIADPNYVETIALPSSGSVNFHTTCGADVVANSPKTTGTGTLLSDLASQAKSVMDAGKGSTNPGVKTSGASANAVPAAAVAGSSAREIVQPGTPAGPSTTIPAAAFVPPITDPGTPVGPHTH